MGSDVRVADPRTRITFDELLLKIRPLVLEHVPGTISVEKARTIAEDVTYMIHRGKAHSD